MKLFDRLDAADLSTPDFERQEGRIHLATVLMMVVLLFLVYLAALLWIAEGL